MAWNPVRVLVPAGLLLLASPAALAQSQGELETPDHPLASHRAYETRANTFTYNRQMDQSLDVAADGRVLVAWDSRRQEHGTFGVFAQLFDPLGRPIGTEIHVNEYMPGNQIEPSVAFAPDGSAWIAWTSITERDGEMGEVLIRRFADRTESLDDGAHTVFAPITGEIRVNESTLGHQQDPRVLVNGRGEVFVAWTSDHANRKRTAFARRFSAEGIAMGGEFRLSSTDAGHETMPALALLSGDRMVAAWARTDADGDPDGVHARLFDREGKALGEEFAIHSDASLQHVEPTLDSNGSDRFVVAWSSTEGDGEYRATARLFDADGKALTDMVRLPDPAAGAVSGTTAVMGPDGRFAVAYNLNEKKVDLSAERPTQYVSIHAQLFDSSGAQDGEPFRVNQEDEGEQTLQVGLNSRRAAWSQHDQLAIAWHGRIQDDGRAIGLTIHAPESFAPPAPPEVEPVAVLIEGDAVWAQREAPPEWVGVVDPGFARSAPAGPDFGFTAFSITGWIPPDPDLAVGPDRIVAVVNVDMRIFDKLGNQILDTPLEPFWNTNGFVFDPVALYDEKNDRFVIAAAEHDGSQDHFDLAVSTNSTPATTGDWHKYRFNVNSICDFLDFENLGMGDQAYYVAADCFGSGRNYIHIVDKSAVLNGSPTSATSVLTTASIISLGATRNYDTNPPADGYFISSYAAGSPFARIFAITNPLSGSPGLTSFDLNIGSFSNPPNAQQKGSTSTLDTIDHRFKNGVVRDGIMYVSHNVSGGDGAAKARWYKIDLRGWPTSGSTPILLDKGDVNEGTNVDSWFADVNVDANGNMALAFNRSSPNQYVGVYRTYRNANDPAGTVQPSVEMQISTAPDTTGRYGDYAGLEEDPVAPSTFWNHHEYVLSSWRTWIGQFTIPSTGGLVFDLPPLIRGANSNLSVTGAIPGETVIFLWSRQGTGPGPCPGSLGGLCLDLLPPVNNAGSAVADAAGNANLSVSVPASAPLVQIWAQAVAQRGVGGVDSVKSNVDTETVQ